jgi:hypothetical protein
MQVAVYPSRVADWSDTLRAPKPSGEPPSQMASRGSTRQASESCW